MTNTPSPALARQQLQQAVAQSPDDRQLFGQLAQALEQMEAYEELLALLATAIERWPRESFALMTRSRIQTYLGDFQAARSGYLQVLQRQPDNIEALCSLVMQGNGADIGGLAALESRLAATDLPDTRRARLRYAQARLLEEERRFDEAFDRLREANGLRATAGGMNITAKQKGARAVIRDIKVDIVRRLAGRGNESQCPVFIVGMPRSGTTLTEQILASHRDIHAAGEKLFWGNTLGTLIRSAPPGNVSMAEAIDSMQPRVWKEAGDNYLRQMREVTGDAMRITDKLPANFGLLPYIRLIFPRARIIHLRREPLATIASCIRTPFADPQLAFSIEDWARFYGLYQALMDCWRPMLGEQILDVDYEELVSDFPAQAQRMVDFLGLEWDEACLHPEKQRRAVRTASAQQVRQAVHTDAINNWRRYESALAAVKPLIEESRAFVLEACDDPAR